MWQDSHALITPNVAAGPLNGGMFATDKIMEERAREGGPIRVAMVGSGPLARVIALQLATDLPDVRLVAIADDDLEAARSVCVAAGMPASRIIESSFGLCAAIRAGECAVTRQWGLLCESDEIDAIIEATDVPARAVDVIRLASETGKHVIPTSAEPEESARDVPPRPTDRVEIVPIEVDATNFFDIVRPEDDGGSMTSPETGDRHRRPAAQA